MDGSSIKEKRTHDHGQQCGDGGVGGSIKWINGKGKKKQLKTRKKKTCGELLHVKKKKTTQYCL